MSTESDQFEDEVRRIARELWPSGEFGGAAAVDGRQRDGIFETEDQIHCIECTLSRGKDKAVEDGAKLDKLTRRLASRGKFVKGWFITKQEPTADQRDVISKYQQRVVACSFDQFRSRLVDARSYLSLREKYPFGSVRDPATGVAAYSLDYVPLDIVDGHGASHGVDAVGQRLAQGGRVVLVGDYGAGKSSTARQVFLTLAKHFWDGETGQFPVMLNLRDHHGQTDPVEALERHARNVGFSSPSALVRGWRAGYCILILDGFDEIASAGWAGQAKRLRDLRYRSMELVRRIQRETPAGAGLLMTGRTHFFDSDRELTEGLGLAATGFLRLHVAEFSTDQVQAFLLRLGWKSGIPEWLPTRPLLLAYLAKKGLLDPKTIGVVAMTPAAGWDHLLLRIAERESEIEAGIDAGTVRKLIERLASEARSSFDGIGPLSPEQIQHAFRTVCGYSPDDRGAVLLQRLPGLGGTSVEDGSRTFIDLDYVDAARAGDVVRFVEHPFSSGIDASGWETTMGDLGVEVASFRCRQSGSSDGALSVALKVACEGGFNVLGADVVGMLASQGARYDEVNVYLKEVVSKGLSLEEGVDLRGVEFQDSMFSRVDLAQDVSPESLPIFRRCHFSLVVGRTSKADLPLDRFPDCQFEEFELAASTTRALLALPLPLAGRVLLTVLKKLYVQKGTGRKDKALSRGLDTKAREALPAVLDLLRREGFAIRTKQGNETVWLPAKGAIFRQRSLAILAAPIANSDPMMTEAKGLL